MPRSGWTEIESHPSLKQAYSIPKLEVEFLMGFHRHDSDVGKHPYANHLVATLLQYAKDFNHITVVEFSGDNDLAGEIGIMADISPYTKTDGENAYMQFRWLKQEDSNPDLPDFNYLRKGIMRLALGSVQKVLEGGVDRYDFPGYNELVVITNTDAQDAKGKVHGEFIRGAIPVADLDTKNSTVREAKITRPWLLQFVMEFERARRHLDSGYIPVSDPRQDANVVGNFRVNLSEQRIFI